MTITKKKAPALDGVSGAIDNQNKNLERRIDSVNTIQPQTTDNFDTRFKLSTGQTRILIEAAEDPVVSERRVVSLNGEDSLHLRLRPEEALSVAAALQAVATYLLEEPRQLRRRTEPGEPDQNGIGGGL